MSNDDKREIPGFSGYYAYFDGSIVGPRGVRSYGCLHHSGYKQVNVAGKSKQVHRLIAMAFLGSPPTPDHEVAHNDGTRDNNRVDNLRWATRSENQLDRRKHGTVTAQRGSKGPRVKLTEDEVREIRKMASTGLPQKYIAEKFGVSQSSVNNILTGKTWSSLS